jgi:hypothetical protein
MCNMPHHTVCQPNSFSWEGWIMKFCNDKCLHFLVIYISALQSLQFGIRIVISWEGREFSVLLLTVPHPKSIVRVQSDTKNKWRMVSSGMLPCGSCKVRSRATRRNIPEDTILHRHSRENLKSYKKQMHLSITTNDVIKKLLRITAQNHWACRLYTLSLILNKYKTQLFGKLDSVSSSGKCRKIPTLLGRLERANLNRQTSPVSETLCFPFI